LTVFEGDTVIGNRVLIHSQCHITKGVIIEDDVFIAPLFCGANTPRIVHGRDYSLILEPYHIRRAARIGIGVSILPEVTIGANALIGAGSVVTRNVPDGECWFGNPAIFKKMVPVEELL
jgi:acetyltransferase-like isoleucine patch superfamily enzyme